MIKIDAEGGEFSVLKGMESWLRENEATIAMEFHASSNLDSSHHQAEKWLHQLGYRTFAILENGNTEAVEDVDQYLEEKGLESDNLIFIKA